MPAIGESRCVNDCVMKSVSGVGGVTEEMWVLFRVGDSLFGASGAQISQIVTPDFSLLGKLDSLNFPYFLPQPGKSPIACAELSRILFPPETPKVASSTLLLLKQSPLALLVGDIVDVLGLPKDELRPLPLILRKIRLREAICGIGFREDRSFCVLDLDGDMLLSPEERQEAERLLKVSSPKGRRKSHGRKATKLS
ncbi:MAG: hypothetical protein HYU64_11840 [Armatimonadetes bacterium]|nr:hypothetical protein [Armatimonadota bacterium]